MTTAFAVPPQLRISALKDNTNRALIDTDTQTDEGNQSITVTMRTNEAEGALMDTCDPITNYRITIAYPDNSTLSHTTGSPTETIPLNRSCVQCIVVAQAQTEHGYGPNSEPRSTTFGPTPNRPSNVQAVPDPTVMNGTEITWSPGPVDPSDESDPSGDEEEKDVYIVGITNEDGTPVTNVTTNQTKIAVPTLDPCRVYHISVRASNKYGSSSKPTDPIAYIGSRVPGAPRITSTNAVEEDWLLTWSSSALCEFRIYDVVITEGNVTTTEVAALAKSVIAYRDLTQTAVLIKHLPSCATYTVRVIGLTNAGLKLSSQPQQVYFAGEKLRPIDMKVRVENSHIQLSWNDPGRCRVTTHNITITNAGTDRSVYSELWQNNSGTVNVNVQPCSRYQVEVHSQPVTDVHGPSATKQIEVPPTPRIVKLPGGSTPAHRVKIEIDTTCQETAEIDAQIRLANGTEMNITVQPDTYGQATLDKLCTDCEINLVGRNEYGTSKQTGEIRIGREYGRPLQKLSILPLLACGVVIVVYIVYSIYIHSIRKYHFIVVYLSGSSKPVDFNSLPLT
ncbi:unnamed protein product [Echinostoma caproni]|uniref:Fibronectin type-III domain-containing protein n=1 Tax=Echinostoma caproni TaxID=27848 RepID=A0A183AFE2_9TREM|nr:unnamed protein product [Echinostoma caproni]